MPKQQIAKQPAKRTRHLYGAAIIGILIIALAGTWWYLNGPNLQLSSIFPANSAEQKDSTEEPKHPTNPNDITDAQNNTFKIPELGIQFVLPEGLEGLEYTLVYNDDANKVVSLSSEALIKADPRCSSEDSTALGLITSMPDTADPKELLGPYVALNDDNFKHINERYIILQAPQSGCSDKTDALNLQTEQGHLLWSAFKTTSVIENQD